MGFTPWIEQVGGARFSEEPPVEEKKSSKWSQLMPWKEEFIWPWEWDKPEFQELPQGVKTASKIGLGVGLGAGGLATGMALPGWLGAASGMKGLGWLTAPALGAMAHPTATGIAGLGAGLYGSATLGNVPDAAPPGEFGGPPGAAMPMGAVPPTIPGGVPPTVPTTEMPSVLPQPGDEGTMGAGEQPVFFTDEQGQRWVYNDYTGAWSQVQAPITRGPTVEQQADITAEERAHQLAMLQEQYRLEQGAMTQQAGAERGRQEAEAAQRMAQMYAADPYKYWAQLGMGTPGAVSRLTGGEVGPGEQFQQGVPLSTPSSQWWQNLLPSEQQQISGGLNWMGVDPQDWYSMYQRMIPGLGQRQAGPQWTR